MASHEERFDRHFNELQKHIDESGKLNLPRDSIENAVLATWVHRQLQRKRVPPSQRERIETLRRLLDYAPRWQKNNEAWHGFLEELICYRREFHTFVISTKEENHRKLSDWATRQRKLARAGNLAADRREALVAIGFDIPNQKPPYRGKRQYTEKEVTKWEELFQKLADYKAQHGHCNVCYYDTGNLELGRWVSLQRVTYRRGMMDEDRARRLGEFGLVWFVGKGKKKKSTDEVGLIVTDGEAANDTNEPSDVDDLEGTDLCPPPPPSGLVSHVSADGPTLMAMATEPSPVKATPSLPKKRKARIDRDTEDEYKMKGLTMIQPSQPDE
jgi:hypothetical protein